MWMAAVRLCIIHCYTFAPSLSDWTSIQNCWFANIPRHYFGIVSLFPGIMKVYISYDPCKFEIRIQGPKDAKWRHQESFGGPRHEHWHVVANTWARNLQAEVRSAADATNFWENLSHPGHPSDCVMCAVKTLGTCLDQLRFMNVPWGSHHPIMPFGNLR